MLNKNKDSKETMSEIITYENLYEILRKEKYSQEIQKLDKEFCFVIVILELFVICGLCIGI